MGKVDRAILQANDQNIGDFGDPDKIENSIKHLADVLDANDNGFNAHKDATELAHPDKSVTEKKLADASVSKRTIQPGAVGRQELDPTLFEQTANAAKFQSIDAQFENVANIAYTLNLTGVSDISQKIQAVYDGLPEGSTFKLPFGSYDFSTPLSFNRKINVDATGCTLNYKGTLSPALKIGKDNGIVFDIRINNLVVKQPTNWATDRVGIEVVNVYSSTIGVATHGFKQGIKFLSRNLQGNVYNTFIIGEMIDNKESIVIDSDPGGWVNENSFYCQRFHWNSIKDVTGAVHVKINYLDYQHNNNKFYNCSFEGSPNNSNNDKAYAIDCNGRYNTFLNCRYENIVKIRVGAQGMDNIFLNGFGLLVSNIEDLGMNTTLIARGSVLLNNFIGGYGFKARPNSNTYKNFVGTTTAGIDSFYVLGNGSVVSTRDIYAENGFRFGTSDASMNDRGIFHGTGSPEGVVAARQGSLYVNRSGGAGTTLYVKESGIGNTGWIAK